MIDLEPRVACLYCQSPQSGNAFNCTQCGGPLPIRQVLAELEDDEHYDPIESAEAITALMFRQTPPAVPAGWSQRIFPVYRFLSAHHSGDSARFEFPPNGVLAYLGISAVDPEPFFRARIRMMSSEIVIDTPVLRAPAGFELMLDLDNFPYVMLELRRPSDTELYPRDLRLDCHLVYWRKEGRW